MAQLRSAADPAAPATDQAGEYAVLRNRDALDRRLLADLNSGSAGPADVTGALDLLPAALAGNATMTFVTTLSAASQVTTLGPVATDDTSDSAVRGDVARAQTGLSGAGIRVGILSDSFNLGRGAAADVAQGNLPARTFILKEGAAGHDEGRAMADLVHKIAPGATILFASATGGSASFAANIAQLQAAGCKIIVDDVSYLDEPFFQDGGVIQRAVQAAVTAGVNYFTSASNEGTDFYQAGFRSLQTTLPGLPGIWTVNNFAAPGASGRGYVTLSIPRNGTAYVDLQWDQPFASISGGDGATSNLALALYTGSGQLIGTAGTLGGSHDPRQLLQFTNTTDQTGFRLVVLSDGRTAPPDMFKFIVYGAGSIQDPAAGQGSGTVTGHELVAGANTVGAVPWWNTSRYGGTNQVESFSSVGQGQILFDAQGHRLTAPQTTQKVDFVAPDGSMTSVFAPFYGTSAAAPNAAAVAALILQADPYLTPGQVSGILAQSAQPAIGPAHSTGAGLIQADMAVHLAQAALLHHA